MATPFFDLIEELRALDGAPKVSYPTGATAYPSTERVIKAKRGTHILEFGSPEPDATKFPGAVLVEQRELRTDAQMAEVYRKYDTLPGGVLTSKKTTQWGTATTTIQENVAATSLPVTSATADADSEGQNATESKITSTTYDAMPSPWLYSYQVDPETAIGTRIQKRLNVNGAQGGIMTPPTVAITSASVANPTVLTIAGGITIKNGEQITIAGDENATVSIGIGGFVGLPSGINGQWPATVIDATHISIPANVTSVFNTNFGTVRIAALIYVETQELNDRQCIEIWSQVDSSTLPGATKSWAGYLQYPWKDVLVGIDTFLDFGVSNTSNAGGFSVPTQLTWAYGDNTDVEIAIRTVRYTGKTLASIVRSYYIGSPPVDDVLQIRTSSGEVIMEATSTSTHQAVSYTSNSTGVQTSVSNSVHYKTARIEDVLTGTFTSGNLAAFVDLKLDPSSPTTFTPGDTFIASSDICGAGLSHRPRRGRLQPEPSSRTRACWDSAL